MAKSFRFDEASVRRIARQVLHSERALRNPIPDGGGGGWVGDSAWVSFENNYAGEIPAFGVVALSSAEAVPSEQFVIYGGDRTGTTLDELYGVNGPEAVPQGGFGRCILHGPAVVKFDFGNPSFGDRYGFRKDNFGASKGYGSFVTVGEVVNDTDKWMKGFIRQPTTFLCEATAGIAVGSSTSYTIMIGTAGSETDAGFSTVSSAYFPRPIEDEERFLIHLVNEHWECGGGGGGGGSRKFKALLSADLAKADANASIDTVTAIDGGAAPSPTTAVNFLNWAGSNNDACLIEETWSGGTVTYMLTAVAWDIVSPVTTVDTSGTALRQAVTDHIGKANAAEDSPTTIDAGTNC